MKIYELLLEKVIPPYLSLIQSCKKSFISPFILKVFVLSTFGFKDSTLCPDKTAEMVSPFERYSLNSLYLGVTLEGTISM